MIADGTLIELEIEGLKQRHVAVASDGPALEALAAGRVPRGWKPLETTTSDEATFLSPLDPVIADRDRTRALFEFDYKWEGLRQGREAEVRLLRAADPLGRQARRPLRREGRSSVDDARDPRPLALRTMRSWPMRHSPAPSGAACSDSSRSSGRPCSTPEPSTRG